LSPLSPLPHCHHRERQQVFIAHDYRSGTFTHPAVVAREYYLAGELTAVHRPTQWARSTRRE
jgi:hypothetical protein